MNKLLEVIKEGNRRRAWRRKYTEIVNENKFNLFINERPVSHFNADDFKSAYIDVRRALLVGKHH